MSDPKNHKNDPFFKLMESEALHRGRFKDFLQELLPIICKEAGAYRITFWLYRERNDEFEAIQHFCEAPKKSLPLPIVDLSAFPDFEEKLKNQKFTYTDQKTSLSESFALEHLVKNGIWSWAGIQVINDKQLFGILSLEWKDLKPFDREDQLLLICAASMISQCYDALLRLKEVFLHKNEVTTLKEEEQEKERLAKKLSDHAHYTSHSIRHPITTILALIDLIKLNWENREAYEELLQQLKIETMKLDDTIRVMTAKIELD